MKIELTELVDKIIGDYSTHGESNRDEISLKNLNEVSVLLVHFVISLAVNTNEKDSHMASVKAIGQRSYKILKDTVDYINDYLEPK